MNILHCVESYYPSPGGMQEVARQLSERLVKMGHRITVATRTHSERQSGELNGVQIKEFDVNGNDVIGMTGNVEGYRNFLLNTPFDVVSFFAAQQWATDAALPVLDAIHCPRVFVPTGFSGLYDPAYKEYFESMKGWMKQFDMNVFLSDNYRDMQFARKHGVEKTILIPNGAGEDEFLSPASAGIRNKLNIPAGDFLVLHVGSYTKAKGHSEALDIFMKSSLQNATLLMIGNNNDSFRAAMKRRLSFYLQSVMGKFSNKKVIITSMQRKDTVAAYQSADLFLFPSNVECSPIVLFECMASATPFLTSDAGNAAEIVSWSNSGIVLPGSVDKKGNTHVDIAKSTVVLNQLYKDKQERERMKLDGLKAWKERFTWEIITKEYETLYAKLASR